MRSASGPIPIQYERNLYLAAGVTTAREVGGVFEKTKQWRGESAAHTIVAPRIILYPMLANLKKPGEELVTPDQFRAAVREAKERGADGVKLIGPMDKDTAAAAIDESKKVGLPTTVHIAVGEAKAKDFIDDGVNCIEHFYGIPDSALDGIQDFPPETNMANEIHRFGRAGELYIQNNLNPEKLSALLDDMVARHVAWSPTLSTYEATRDLTRAENLPWYKDYLHPSLQEYMTPSMTRHATFFIGWTTTNEVNWRHNYEVWMRTLLEFGRKGGTITTGDDSGFLWGSMYGFGISRELEMQQEAGFAPLEVIEHATINGAKVLGLSDKVGRVRQGMVADLLVVNGNPLENLAIMNPYGTDLMTYNGQVINNMSGAREAGRSERQDDPRRRHRVDDQGRHSVSRADADERSEGHGQQGARGALALDRPRRDSHRGHEETWPQSHEEHRENQILFVVFVPLWPVDRCVLMAATRTADRSRGLAA